MKKTNKTTTLDMPITKDSDDVKKEHPAVNPMDNVTNSTPNQDTDVTEEEKELLDKTNRSVTGDTDIAEKLALDNTDGEDPLNESADPSDLGADLDVPGAELDDENEEIGEEDEENNPYTNSNIDDE